MRDESLAACGGSHADEVNCASKELGGVEAKLQASYGKMRADAEKMDKAMKEAGSLAFGNSEEALIKSQKAFESYMQSECERRVENMQGGTAGAGVEISCRKQLISERMKALTQ